MKPWYESKSLWAAVLGAVLLLLEAIPPEYAPWVLAVVAVLRVVRSNLTGGVPPVPPAAFAVLALLATSCAPAWPEACKVEVVDGRRELVCRGERADVFAGGQKPGGTVGVELDAVRLPIRVHGQAVTLPRCVEEVRP